MPLFEKAIDYSQDVFRNIRGIKESQHLFDDLNDDPLNWEAANLLDMHTHPELMNAPLIQRPFDYSKNDFIDYPFEHITASRFNDGTIACWYGSESLETTLYETGYHFIREIQNAWEVFKRETLIKIDRRVALVHCHGLAFDLADKVKEFPWLIDSLDYSACQKVGRRVAKEGHPLLRVPSARHMKGINLVVFKTHVLSNPRDFCKLQYVLDLPTGKMKIYRGEKSLKFEGAFAEISGLFCKT